MSGFDLNNSMIAINNKNAMNTHPLLSYK
jgi:hypothetical protein